MILPPLSSSAHLFSQQYPLATVALHTDGRNDATAQPTPRREQPEELRLPPPPPHLQLPSNYPGQAAHLPDRPVPIPPSEPLRFTGPSSSSLSTTSKAKVSLISASPSTASHPVFDVKVSNHSEPNMTITHHTTHVIVATACWSKSSGSNTLRMWPGTGREVEVTLIKELGSVPERTRIENMPFGWEGQSRLRWQVDVSATGYVLRDDSGRVLARWNTVESQQTAIGGNGSIGIPEKNAESRYLSDDVHSHILHAESGLQSPDTLTASGCDGGNEISGGGKALRRPGEPLLTILAAPPGTDVSSGMWVEFVVASGVCVLNRESVVGGDALNTMF